MDCSVGYFVADHLAEIEAIEALLTLGYKDLQARTAVSKVISQNNKLEVAQIVKEALKYL